MRAFKNIEGSGESDSPWPSSLDNAISIKISRVGWLVGCKDANIYIGPNKLYNLWV